MDFKELMSINSYKVYNPNCGMIYRIKIINSKVSKVNWGFGKSMLSNKTIITNLHKGSWIMIKSRKDLVNMKSVQLLYHDKTNTYWSNDVNWKELWKEEKINYGHIEMDTDNIFIIKKSMNQDGFELVKDLDGTPFKSKY